MKTYSVTSAAEVCFCSADSIYKAVREGSLKARKVGRSWVITEENLERFLNAGVDGQAAKHEFRNPIDVPLLPEDYIDPGQLRREIMAKRKLRSNR